MFENVLAKLKMVGSRMAVFRNLCAEITTKNILRFIMKRHVVVLIKYYLTIKQSTQQLSYISEMSH
jgi:hypothetical protein